MTVHLHITGRVQGVWYRGSTQREARALGLSGWVRNLPDGRVEAEACGPREALEALVAWCHDGPELASVTDVQAIWSEPSGTYVDFQVRP